MATISSLKLTAKILKLIPLYTRRESCISSYQSHKTAFQTVILKYSNMEATTLEPLRLQNHLEWWASGEGVLPSGKESSKPCKAIQDGRV